MHIDCSAKRSTEQEMWLSKINFFKLLLWKEFCFSEDNELSGPFLAEEKVMVSVHAHAMCQLTVAKVRKVYNKVDSKSIAKQVRKLDHATEYLNNRHNYFFLFFLLRSYFFRKDPLLYMQQFFWPLYARDLALVVAYSCYSRAPY